MSNSKVISANIPTRYLEELKDSPEKRQNLIEDFTGRVVQRAFYETIPFEDVTDKYPPLHGPYPASRLEARFVLINDKDATKARLMIRSLTASVAHVPALRHELDKLLSLFL